MQAHIMYKYHRLVVYSTDRCVLKKSGWSSWSSGHLSFLKSIFIAHCSCSLICSFIFICPDLILVSQIVRAICSRNSFFLIGQLSYWHHRLDMPCHCTHFQLAYTFRESDHAC